MASIVNAVIIGKTVDTAIKNSDNSSFTSSNDDSRADNQEKDIEAKVGELVSIDGMNMTVTSVDRRTELGQFDKAGEGKTFIVANISMQNSSDSSQPFNAFDFRIQTVGGQVLDTTFATAEPRLESGDLVQGGKAAGNIVFEVPVETGQQYIIWKPNFLDSTRAVIAI